MHWIEALYRTYENQKSWIGKIEQKTVEVKKKKSNEVDDEKGKNPLSPLLPLFHSLQQAHVTIVINKDGQFVGAFVNRPDDSSTIIPVTEDSESRSSDIASHPLCDKLKYVAQDSVDFFQKDDKLEKRHKSYLKLLDSWKEQDSDNSMLQAIWIYVKKGTLIRDLVREGILFCDKENHLLKVWNKKNQGPKPPIFNVLKQGKETQEDVFVRWQVEGIDDCPQAYLNKKMYESWKNYRFSHDSKRGLCYITGEECLISTKFPRGIRSAGDKAKLISSNDDKGYTYRGRFKEAEESYGLGAVVSQKAHSALRWLLARQGYADGTQSILVWSPGFLQVPSPCDSSYDWSENGVDEEQPEDTAQQIADLFKKLIQGANRDQVWHDLDEALKEQMVYLLALDSASQGQGRLSVTRYMEFRLVDYLDNLRFWYDHCKWEQWKKREQWEQWKEAIQYLGSPSPKMIVEAAYGESVDKKLCRFTVNRILPCVLFRTPIPSDIEHKCVKRASKKQSFKHTKEWEMTLGVTCSIYIYNHQQQERPYTMSLDTQRTERSYLYGRLWAIADELESYAQFLTKADRPTNATRLMTRFQMRPYETWMIMESRCLPPYQRIVRKKRSGVSHDYDQLIDEVMGLFDRSDFESNKPLDGSYLLGYHCQRSAIKKRKEEASTSQESSTEE